MKLNSEREGKKKKKVKKKIRRWKETVNFMDYIVTRRGTGNEA